MARDKGTGSIHQRKDGKWVGTFEAGWTERGTRRRATVVRKTKREAAVALRKKRAEYAQTGAPKEGQDRAISVKAYCEKWLARRRSRVSQSAYKNDETAVNKWIVPTLGHIKVNAVIADHVYALDTAMRKGRLAGSSRVRYDGTLRTILKAAVNDGINVPPSALTADKPVKRRPDTTSIPLEDAVKILAVAMERPDRSRWMCALLEALRPAEALGLTWDRIDLEAGLADISWQLKPLSRVEAGTPDSGYFVPDSEEAIHLYRGYHLTRPKTDAGERVIPLVDPVVEALREWELVAPANEWGLVWPRENGLPQMDKADRAVWREICERAGVEPYRLYAARHTTATMLRAMDVPDEVIMAIMGHSSILSTRAYIHTQLDQMRRALDGVASQLVPAPVLEG